MKRFFKTLSAAAGALVLTVAFQNCKQVTIDGKKVIIIDPILETETYQGSTMKMSYGDGGWYGLQGVPNYNAYLNMQVDQAGKIQADLQYVVSFVRTATSPVNPELVNYTKECKAKGTVLVEDYVQLEELVKNSQANAFCVGNDPCPQMVDGGSKAIVLFDEANKATKYHLRSSNDDMQKGELVLLDPSKVQAKIDEIIAKLKSSNDCSQLAATNVKKLHYSVDGGFDDIANHPKFLALLNYPFKVQKIDWTVEVTSSALLVTSVTYEKNFSSAFSYTTSKRTYSNIALDSNLIAALNEIKPLITTQICLKQRMLMPDGDIAGTKVAGIEVSYQNGSSFSGEFDCGSRNQASDPKNFIGQVNDYLASLKK